MKNEIPVTPEMVRSRYPPPYKVIDGCLYRECKTKHGSYDQKLCNFLPYLISEVTIDDGAEVTKRLKLGGFKHNGQPLPEIEITGSELANFNWLIDQWGSDCILEVGASVKENIRYAIQQTAGYADRQAIYAVTGWKKIDDAWHFLMPGNDTLTVRLPDKLSRYEGTAVTDPTAVSVLADFMEKPPAPQPVIHLLLAYTFLTPLSSFLHAGDCEPKFVFLLLGRTGTRKSTLAALFLSFFGHFTASDLPMSFRDTANSILYHAFALRDVLTCIDDFHPCGRQEEAKLTATAQAIMRAFGDRTGRARLKADATPMASRAPQGNAIITAEYPPDIGESGTARYFPVELKPGEVDLETLSCYQALAAKGFFRICMHEYTDWIRDEFLQDERMEAKLSYTLRKRFEEYRDEFNQSGIPCHGRLPEIVAWFRLGMLMLLHFLMDRKAITEDRGRELMDEFADMLFSLARQQAESIEQDKPSHIFVRKLFSLIESGQVTILDKRDPLLFQPKEHIGYEDEEYFYLFSDAAHRAVRKLCEDQGEMFSVTTRALLKDLAGEGLIDTADGQNTKTVRFGSTTKRVMCLKKSAARYIAEGGV